MHDSPFYLDIFIMIMASSLLDTLRIAIEEFLWSTGWTEPPISSIFFIFVTILMSLMSNVLNHLLIDMKSMTRETEIMNKHNQEKKLAMSSGDKRLWLKVQRREPMIQEMQQKSMMARLLPQIVNYGPLIFIFTTLRIVFQADVNEALNFDLSSCDSSCGGVVVLPFGIPSNFPLFGKWSSAYSGNSSLSIFGYGVWYFLSAIVTSTFFLRILGVNLSRNPQQKNSIM